MTLEQTPIQGGWEMWFIFSLYFDDNGKSEKESENKKICERIPVFAPMLAKLLLLF